MNTMKELADQLDLQADTKFTFRFVDGTPGTENAVGVYKCGMCGETGSFIGTPTHFKRADTEYEADYLPSWASYGAPVSIAYPRGDFWCAGRPELKR